MSALLVVGWLLAVAAAGLLLLTRRSASRRAELVARACHELRGPLTNLLLALDRAPLVPTPRLPGGGPVASALEPALALELVRARRAVEDLSAAAAGVRRRDERRPVDLDALVRDVAAIHDAVARGRGRRVVVGGGRSGAVVVGDRARLAQAIGNLTQNALDHGTGTVRVGVRRRSGTAEVLIADDGHGLEVPIERLLRRPLRGQRGRGLRIVSEAIVGHGGRLRSLPSRHGARLVAELPLVGRETGVRAR